MPGCDESQPLKRGVVMVDLDQIDVFLKDCTFPNSARLHCAVSGGPDSSALLILASMTGLNVTAYHVDHGLRPDGPAERDLVGELCQRVNAEFETLTVEVEPGSNLEARARSARFASLPSTILTGHTADDQAETILLHLLRGGGLDASAGMRSEHHPILSLRRADTKRVCELFDWQPFDDPSNTDPRFRRNRVRNEVIPLLNEVAERDVVPLLTRAGHLAGADRDLLDELALLVDPTDSASLANAPLPLARRAIRQWLRGEHPPNAAVVERVLAVARGEFRGTEISDGRSVRRTTGKLRIETSSKEHSHTPDSG